MFYVVNKSGTHCRYNFVFMFLVIRNFFQFFSIWLHFVKAQRIIFKHNIFEHKSNFKYFPAFALALIKNKHPNFTVHFYHKSARCQHTMSIK